ncbi:NAD(P)-binding domain-containing protein [Streptomyces atroolivaceus]|uniref:NADPH-dependent F420 reductase n=1 Tax=Streptomyces atroolivaceus TaxID=66869 RepID=A0ABV9VFX1_STRAZ|nr:NAD(P)-binding domain-containing protein [Streptomyces atroolivaceus]
MRIGIIGAGMMGLAVARRVALTGTAVLLADRSVARARRVAAEASAGAPGCVLATTMAAALRSEVVFLALRLPESLELARRQPHVLRGRAVVDLSVPERTDPVSSAVRQLVCIAPEARWVKALTTADAGALHRGATEGHPVDVFVASDDDRAKVVVVELFDRSGVRAFDAGGLDNAWILEGMGRLGQEVGERLGLSESWSFKFMPSW